MGNLLSSRIQYTSAAWDDGVLAFPPMPLRSFPPDVAGGGVVYSKALPFRNWEGVVAGNLRASFLKVDGRGKINPFPRQIQPVHKVGYSQIG